MAIFNSYVSLPEGTIYPNDDFLGKIYDIPLGIGYTMFRQTYGPIP